MDEPSSRSAVLVTKSISQRLVELRELVFKRWLDTVRSTIPEAKELNDKTLINALNGLFDELVLALGKSRPYYVATPGTGPSFVHGRERANSTGYGSTEILKELQLFRQVIFEVADANKLCLSSCHRSIIGRSIDAAMCDAVNSFAIVQKETGETFIKSLSHDLRNPLHVASASMQLIQLKSQEKNVLMLAQRAHDKLSDIDKMIETLLDAASIKGRKKFRLQIRHFNMTELAREVCSDMSSAEHPIVCAGKDVEGYWCSSSLKRVLENLLSNAQKYGQPNAEICVDIKCDENNITLSVHNEGRPISHEQQHLLFSAFHRLENVTLTGWGLGLPFVQLVTESHGGVVNVKSTAEHGTTFSISMPLDCRPYSID